MESLLFAACFPQPYVRLLTGELICGYLSVPENPVHSSTMPFQPARIDGYVDYLAAVKAWDKDQAGKYVIYTEEHEDESRV